MNDRGSDQLSLRFEAPAGSVATSPAPNVQDDAQEASGAGICHLSPRWRVTDDGFQWIGERLEARPTKKSSGWRGKKFWQDRNAMLRSIAEYITDPDPEALTSLAALQERHPGRVAHDQEQLAQFYRDNPKAAARRAKQSDCASAEASNSKIDEEETPQ